MLPLLILALQTAPAAAPASPDKGHLAQCLKLATSDPEQAVSDATLWRVQGGGFEARQCQGVAYANQGNWNDAAGAFEEAARAAAAGKSPQVAGLWASAGNAWLAAGDAAKARIAIDAALAAGTLGGLELGEAHLDRGRALVALGDMDGARSDIDKALTYAGDDPLAWLLSATLARRMNDLPRAAKDITEALAKSGDDPSVQLEAGNIAAASGNEADARTAWNRVIELAPGSPIATAARGALAQFGATEK